MNQELWAYLMRDNGQVSKMPTDDLQAAFDQLKQKSDLQRQNTSSDEEAAVYEFLQTLKHVMQSSRDKCSMPR